jgi:hypothetical protein
LLHFAFTSLCCVKFVVTSKNTVVTRLIKGEFISFLKPPKIKTNISDLNHTLSTNRIGELLRRKSRKRTEEARKAELAEIERNNILKARGSVRDGASSHQDSDGASSIGGESRVTAPFGLTQRPTLPNIDVELDVSFRPAHAAVMSSSSSSSSTLGRSGPHYVGGSSSASANYYPRSEWSDGPSPLAGSMSDFGTLRSGTGSFSDMHHHPPPPPPLFPFNVHTPLQHPLQHYPAHTGPQHMPSIPQFRPVGVGMSGVGSVGGGGNGSGGGGWPPPMAPLPPIPVNHSYRQMPVSQSPVPQQQQAARADSPSAAGMLNPHIDAWFNAQLRSSSPTSPLPHQQHQPQQSNIS